MFFVQIKLQRTAKSQDKKKGEQNTLAIYIRRTIAILLTIAMIAGAGIGFFYFHQFCYSVCDLLCLMHKSLYFSFTSELNLNLFLSLFKQRKEEKSQLLVNILEYAPTASLKAIAFALKYLFKILPYIEKYDDLGTTTAFLVRY